MTLDASIESVQKQVNRELLVLGYERTGEPYTYKNTISCDGKTICFCINVSDLNFLIAPPIYIDQSSIDYFPPGSPHIEFNGEVCYLDRESVYLDSHTPVKTIRSCIYHATKIIRSILRGELELDVDREYSLYCSNWGTAEKAYLVSDISDIHSYHFVLVDTPNHEYKSCVVAGTKADIESTLDSWGIKNQGECFFPCVAMNINKPITISTEVSWPPKTWSDFKNWLSAIDNGIKDRLLHYLSLKENRSRIFSVVFESNGGLWGYIFSLKENTLKTIGDIPSGRYRKFLSERKVLTTSSKDPILDVRS